MKTEKQLLQDVTEELAYEPSLDEKEIGVAVSHGIVTLTGRVKSYSEKVAAVRAVERVSGSSAIVNELVVNPLKMFEHTDVDIAEAAGKALAWSSVLPPDRVKIRVERGWVTLEGELDWQFQREAAESAVHPLAGVRGITNLITIKPRVKAEDVKRQITAAFARSAALDAEAIKVEAHDARVTIKGRVHSWTERREAESAAWAAPGVVAVENDLAVVP
jgi:osmotically-inducible protein OsmY